MLPHASCLLLFVAGCRRNRHSGLAFTVGNTPGGFRPVLVAVQIHPFLDWDTVFLFDRACDWIFLFRASPHDPHSHLRLWIGSGKHGIALRVLGVLLVTSCALMRAELACVYSGNRGSARAHHWPLLRLCGRVPVFTKGRRWLDTGASCCVALVT